MCRENGGCLAAGWALCEEDVELDVSDGYSIILIRLGGGGGGTTER